MVQGQIDGGEDFRGNFVMLVAKRRSQSPNNEHTGRFEQSEMTELEFIIGFGRGYLEDTVNKMTITDKEEEERPSKNDEDEAKAEDEPGVSQVKALVRDGNAATDLIITNSRLLAEVTIELEELIPGARTHSREEESFTPRVSQEEKEVLSNGVVIVDLKYDVPSAKDILMRCMKSFTQCSSKPLQPGTPSHSLVADFLLLLDESK
ncbi:hypothetical protein Cgig2_000826 [Carnegiea gigantea]|uniref:Uncharacterized protein n=1 Tax=Carnegiea gigantea TaxID=171969 RepID=A0A9Q1KJT2_9CARY|nr:hypothetical protein Cgig2_000826 [Carnegiea gigantea]